jgi:hypothetical protein
LKANEEKLKSFAQSLDKITDKINKEHPKPLIHMISQPHRMAINDSNKPESVNKMLDHIENGKFKDKLQSSDKNKLFLNNFKDNIEKIDKIANKDLYKK